MSPVTNVTFTSGLSQDHIQHLFKRVNLNPLHYLTLPIKHNWDKIEPALGKFNHYGRIVSILLGGLSLIAILDMHNWKLPRWPWANDGLKNPPPSFTHKNELYTVDDLVEEKLMDVLLEASVNEGLDEILWNRPEKGEEDQIIQAEEQFLEDARMGVEDVIADIEEA